MGGQLDWNRARHRSHWIWSNVRIYGYWHPRLWDLFYCGEYIIFLCCCSRLIYCLVLIIIVWEYLRQSPHPFRPTKIRPLWWTRSLSQHQPRACNQCPCLVVWEEARLPSPSSYGPGLLDDSRWLLLYSNHWYSSLTPGILISNVCGCRACF